MLGLFKYPLRYMAAECEMTKRLTKKDRSDKEVFFSNERHTTRPHLT